MTRGKLYRQWLISLGIGVFASTVVGCAPSVSVRPSSTALPTPSPVAAPTAFAPAADQPITAEGEPATPVHVRLILLRPPHLGDTVEAQLIVSAIQAAPGTTAGFVLPAGVSIAAGQGEQRLDLQPGQPITLSVVLRFDTVGTKEIIGRALTPQPNGDIWGDQAVIYVDVLAAGQTPDQNTPTPPPAVPAS